MASVIDVFNSAKEHLIAEAYNAYRNKRNAATRYGKIWRTFFPAERSIATTVKALFGDAGVATAPVVQWGSTPPEAAQNAGLEQLFEVLPTKITQPVDEKTLVNLQNAILQNSDFVQVAMNFASKVLLSVEARLDAMAVQAMSRGAIVLDSTSNYGGTNVTIDFGVPATRKVGVATAWSDSANAKPLDDIRNWVSMLNSDGAEQDLVLYMDTMTWRRFVNTDQVKNLKITAVAPDYQALAQGVNPIAQALYMSFNLPLIKVVSGTELPVMASGGTSKINFWKEGSVLLTYNGNLGNTYFTPYAELTDKRPDYQAVEVDNILLKTYRENHGITEYFEAKANALPILTVSQDCVLANTEGTTF